jgi:hypothetical protein
MFFTYKQNNSGGSFVKNNNVDEVVSIEANSPHEADAIAESIGIYFGGVSMGVDCECCGDRWTSIYWQDKGTEEPLIYGKPLKTSRYPYKIYYKNGIVESF